MITLQIPHFWAGACSGSLITTIILFAIALFWNRKPKGAILKGEKDNHQ